MKENKRKRFDVHVRVTVDTVLEILAFDADDALDQAREIEVKDVVQFDTSFSDGNVSIKGVHITNVDKDSL